MTLGEGRRLRRDVGRRLDAGRFHGLRLPGGDAVRRSWSVSQSKIDPSKLREVLADAPEFIVESVDVPKLHDAYPSVWERLAKAKCKETIVIRLTGEDGRA